MQMDTSNMQAGASTPKKNNTPIIIAVVVVVILLCCCLVVAVFAGPAIYSRYAASKALSGIGTAMPGGSIPGLPSGSTAGSVPTGGLANDLTLCRSLELYYRCDCAK